MGIEKLAIHLDSSQALLLDQMAERLLHFGVQGIGHVLKAYDEPPHDWGDRTAWRLFNAATFALAGKVAERPDLTKSLHTVIDGVCERLH